MGRVIGIAVVLSSILVLGCSVQELAESVFPDKVRTTLDILNKAIIARDNDAIRSKIQISLSEEQFAE
jgi:hypothetical protein